MNTSWLNNRRREVARRAEVERELSAKVCERQECEASKWSESERAREENVLGRRGRREERGRDMFLNTTPQSVSIGEWIQNDWKRGVGDEVGVGAECG